MSWNLFLLGFVGLAGESILKGDDGDFADCDLADFFVPEYNLSVRKDREASTLGYRYPIWFTACRHKEIQHKLASPGSLEKKTQFVMLQSLSDPTSTAVLAHPDLKYLPYYLVKYLQKFQNEALDLPVSTVTMLYTLVCMYIM
jgi:hypothetical protein